MKVVNLFGSATAQTPVILADPRSWIYLVYNLATVLVR